MQMTTTKNDLLKIIAIVTMLVDHLGVIFFPEYRILRTIGRIAFPIFAYYLAMGYIYTSNRKKYALRLLIFGVISQVPRMFLNAQLEARYLEFNVILMFLYAIGMLVIFDLAVSLLKDKKIWFAIPTFIAFLIIVALPEFLAHWITGFSLSYGTYGLVMILLFYWFYKKPVLLVISYIAISVFFPYLSGASNYANYFNISLLEGFTHFSDVWYHIRTYNTGLAHLEGYFFQARSFMGLILIIVLSRIPMNIKLNKYVAYYFYPVHLVVLEIAKAIIG